MQNKNNFAAKKLLVASLALLAAGYFWLYQTKSQNIDEVIEKEISYCAQKNGENKCYQRTAEILFDNFDYEELLASFQKLEDKPLIFSGCHEVLHYLGRLEYKKSENIKSVLAKSSPVCFAGAYHGSLEEYLASEKIKPDDYAAKLPEVCGARPHQVKSGERDQCLHGLGHALIALADGNLDFALNSCGFLEDERSDEQCQSGVFMEIFNSSTNRNHDWRLLKEDDPFYPCNVLDKRFQKMCYTLIVPRLFKLSDNDWSKSALWCNKFPRQYTDLCLYQLGSIQVGNFQNLEILKNNCQSLAEPGFKEICDRAVVHTLATRYGGDSGKILNYCALAEANDKKNCYKQMFWSLTGWLDKEELAKECAKVPAEYKDACLY